jgi:ATP-dependent HslUV protease ATP-binding subunit HslU
VLEKLLEDISFTATDRSGETIKITPDLVQSQVGDLAKKGDLSKFIL